MARQRVWLCRRLGLVFLASVLAGRLVSHFTTLSRLTTKHGGDDIIGYVAGLPFLEGVLPNRGSSGGSNLRHGSDEYFYVMPDDFLKELVRSPQNLPWRMKLTNNSDLEGAHWIVNLHKVHPELLTLVKESMERRQNRSKGAHVGYWRIYIVDVSDLPGINWMHWYCEQVSNVIGWQNVVFITRSTSAPFRSMGNEFKLPYKTKFHHLGERNNFTQLVGRAFRFVKRYYFYVRSDVVNEIDFALQNISFDGGGTVSEPLKDPTYAIRPKDVAHFWPPQSTGNSASHRSRVSRGILDLAEDQRRHSGLAVFCDIAGWRAKKGRHGVHTAYAKALLEYKIVVVCQRDGWEDHWRLFEALVGGALVMSDPMTNFPKGIVDGESIVVYNSIADLQDKILYYLNNNEERTRIARIGWEVAMNQHREWHRHKEMFLSDCPSTDEYGICVG